MTVLPDTVRSVVFVPQSLGDGRVLVLEPLVSYDPVLPSLPLYRRPRFPVQLVDVVITRPVVGV